MTWNVRLLVVLIPFIAACSKTGIEHGMESQPKAKPLTESDFFPDGRSSRPWIPGTVARGYAEEDDLLYTGKLDGKEAAVFPFAVTRAVLERGRERYDIYCAVCHDRAGTGRGMIVRRGFPQPPSFHTDRLRKAPAGHYVDVITHGSGTMYSYAETIPAEDRWAITAYIRALQLSQNAKLEDAPAEEQVALKEKASLP